MWPSAIRGLWALASFGSKARCFVLVQETKSWLAGSPDSLRDQLFGVERRSIKPVAMQSRVAKRLAAEAPFWERPVLRADWLQPVKLLLAAAGFPAADDQ